MAGAAIQVQNVFKKFRRGAQHGSLRDALAAWIRLRSARRSEAASLQDAAFWALDDVRFEVKPGEALGIIGPNGAGKSTMLKLLAGIMRPNRGSVKINGRVSALIEVGAGFHPDLTGRENIFLNASIMGMSRAAARRKFEEIVDFAEIRDFLDTPIKRYSSGMYARLGFSVAAHVDPQVLLMDEVLSVGDRVFRAKCLDKMRTFLDRGVAVVFVSHDLSSVSSFCQRALVLAAGRVTASGSANEAVAHYHAACADKWIMPEAQGRQLVTVGDMRLLKTDGTASRSFAPGEAMRIEYDVRFDMDMPNPSFGLTLLRASDHLFVFETSSTRMHHAAGPATAGATHRIRYDVRLNVPPGEYCVGHPVRDRDASMYAAIQDEAVRLMVTGEPTSGGMVDLAPRVDVRALRETTPTQPQQDGCPVLCAAKGGD